MLEIVGLGTAHVISARDLKANHTRMRETFDRLHQRLAAPREIRLDGHPEHRQ